MHANSRTATWRLIAPRLLLLPALVVGLSLAVAGQASAQTGSFQATLKGHQPKPQPCPVEPSLCSGATTNYGDATWTWAPTSETPPPQNKSCGSIQATVTFALTDGSSSTLVLDESDTICGHGNSILRPGSFQSDGNPFDFTGSWTVETATGEFGSIPVGTTGTDAFEAAGAQISGTYTTP